MKLCAVAIERIVKAIGSDIVLAMQSIGNEISLAAFARCARCILAKNRLCIIGILLNECNE